MYLVQIKLIMRMINGRALDMPVCIMMRHVLVLLWLILKVDLILPSGNID